MVHVDRRTGEVSAIVRQTAGAQQSFGERAQSVRADAMEHVDGPVEAQFAVLVCDGCGASASIDMARPELPKGWCETSVGDLCGDCAV